VKTEKLIVLFSNFAIILGILGMFIFTGSLVSQFYLPIKNIQSGINLAIMVKLITSFYIIISIVLFLSGRGISRLDNKSRLLLIACCSILLVGTFVIQSSYIIALVKAPGTKAKELWEFALISLYAIANIWFFSRKQVKDIFKENPSRFN
jgi:fucose permease